MWVVRASSPRAPRPTGPVPNHRQHAQAGQLGERHGSNRPRKPRLNGKRFRIDCDFVRHTSRRDVNSRKRKTRDARLTPPLGITRLHRLIALRQHAGCLPS